MSNFKEKCCPVLTTLVSGSPILQNGKIIRAVTHVFVNVPIHGYEIFMENMHEAAQSAADSNNSKKAS